MQKPFRRGLNQLKQVPAAATVCEEGYDACEELSLAQQHKVLLGTAKKLRGTANRLLRICPPAKAKAAKKQKRQARQLFNASTEALTEIPTLIYECGAD